MRDDHNRLVYTELPTDGKAAAVTSFMIRAVSCPGKHGVTMDSVLIDNGDAYHFSLFSAANDGRPNAYLRVYIDHVALLPDADTISITS